MLGRVIEVVSGKSYSACVSEHVYRPAGLMNTGFLRKGERDAAVVIGYFAADAQGLPMMGAQTGRVGSLIHRNPGTPQAAAIRRRLIFSDSHERYVAVDFSTST